MNYSSAICRLERADGSLLDLTGSLTIGRASTNGLVIAAEKVSRRHASLQAQNGGEIWLIDLGSVNGTFVNGRRVFQPMCLRDGDEITIGGERLLFQQEPLEGDDSGAELATVLTIPRVESQRCWLLVADIEGFTPMSQRLAPQELSMVVGKWLRESREIIETQGGSIDKYLGDGYLSFWRDAEGVSAKVLAALAANQKLQAAGEPKFRLVLHVGSVVFGGGAIFAEESMMGPQVNFIFRMEKIAGGVEAPILLSEAAREAMEGLLPCVEVPGEHVLKGFPGTHRFFIPQGPL